MSFTVRMLFEGVFAAVPDQEIEFGKPQEAKKVELFFPHLRSPHDSGDDIESGNIRHPHVVWIEVETRHLDVAQSRKVSFSYQPQDGRSEVAVFLLGSKRAEMPEKFSLLAGGPAMPLSINQTLPAKPYDPEDLPDVERQSLWWILRPYELTGQAGHGEFNTKFGDIAAQVSLSTGYLWVPGFSNEGKPWSFSAYDKKGSTTPPGSQPGRAIGNQLALDLEVNSFALSSIKANDSYKKHLITLKPPPSNEVVGVVFRNAEPEKLMDIETVEMGPDPDFAEAYRRSVGAAVFPWVLPVIDAPVGEKERPCAPALYQKKKV